MSKLKEYCTTIIAIVGVLGLLGGGLAYFAKASDLEMVQLRLDQKIVTDQVLDVQRQLWAIEERNIRHGSDCTKWPDERDRKQYKELKAQYEMLQTRQKDVMKK
jgi:hypothetical protein